MAVNFASRLTFVYDELSAVADSGSGLLYAADDALQVVRRRHTNVVGNLNQRGPRTVRY